jgi:hypothetical protein
MIESPFDLFEIEMEILFRYSTVMIQPMFGVRPKTFNSIDMITSPWSAEFLLNDYVITTNWKERISMPIIGIIQTPRFRMGSHQRDQFFFSSTGDRESEHNPICLPAAPHPRFPGLLPPNRVSSISISPESSGNT